MGYIYEGDKEVYTWYLGAKYDNSQLKKAGLVDEKFEITKEQCCFDVSKLIEDIMLCAKYNKILKISIEGLNKEGAFFSPNVRRLAWELNDLGLCNIEFDDICYKKQMFGNDLIRLRNKKLVEASTRKIFDINDDIKPHDLFAYIYSMKLKFIDNVRIENNYTICDIDGESYYVIPYVGQGIFNKMFDNCDGCKSYKIDSYFGLATIYFLPTSSKISNYSIDNSETKYMSFKLGNKFKAKYRGIEYKQINKKKFNKFFDKTISKNYIYFEPIKLSGYFDSKSFCTKQELCDFVPKNLNTNITYSYYFRAFFSNEIDFLDQKLWVNDAKIGSILNKTSVRLFNSKKAYEDINLENFIPTSNDKSMVYFPKILVVDKTKIDIAMSEGLYIEELSLEDRKRNIDPKSSYSSKKEGAVNGKASSKQNLTSEWMNAKQIFKLNIP